MTDPFPIGSQQSPIKINTENAIPVVYPLDYLVIKYPNTPLHVRLDYKDHNFYFDNPPQIQFNGVTASLQRIHIHSRSEHWIKNQFLDTDFDFEIHFVHPLPAPSNPTAGTGDSTHVVFGVFFKEKAQAATPSSIQKLNKALESNLKANMVRSDKDEPPIETDINPMDFLPANHSQYFRYEGSLTTFNENCKHNPERVSWVVYPNLVEVDPDDVKFLKEHSNETARVLQPINRRFVLRNFS
jgi:carbonic anhydrase